MIGLIVEAALRSLALGTVVWLALAVLRPRNPHLHKTVWSTVLLASIAMPFLIGSNVAPELPAPTYVLTLQAGTGSIVPPAPHWALSASVLYSLVTLALLARFTSGWARMWRIRRHATVLNESWTQDDDVRVSLELRAPATFGSTILLPPDVCEWSAQKLAAVMAHERSHVRLKDCYILWLARLHTCLFWISPLAWWLQRRLAALAETTSDDAVVAELGDRPAYAEVLLEIAASLPAERLATAQMSSSQAHIAMRIERIISDVAPASAPKRRHQLLAVALLLPLISAAAVSLHAQTSSPPTSDEDDPLRPRLISGAESWETGEFYPAIAKVRGIEGRVKVAIDVDAVGTPTAVHVLEANPVDMGFGEAAMLIAQRFRFTNPRGEPARVPMMMKFALKKGPGLPPTASPAPQSTVGG
jgi:TonB family protein